MSCHYDVYVEYFWRGHFCFIMISLLSNFHIDIAFGSGIIVNLVYERFEIQKLQTPFQRRFHDSRKYLRSRAFQEHLAVNSC